MGADGSRGMNVIKLHGGHTVVQDPEDAAVSSMPSNALLLADIEHVLHADEIPEFITSLLSS